MPAQLPLEKRERIVVLDQEIYTSREIATMVGCTPSTVAKTLKRFRETNSNQSRQKSGRPSKVTPKIN